jgi:hypothetical protein
MHRLLRLLCEGVKQLFYISFLLLSLWSCQKDKLKGDSEILVGKWNWTHSNETYETCNPPTFENVLTPETENANYSIEFLEKGKIIFYKDGEEVDNQRLTISFSESPNSTVDYPYSFHIWMPGKENDLFGPNGSNELDGKVGDELLRLNVDFPFPDTYCEDYSSYFVRE